MKVIVALTLVLSFCNLKSQMFSGEVSIPSEKFSAQYFDKSFQNIYYKLRFIKNPKEKSGLKEVISVLNIGEKFTRFSELNTLKYDSLVQEYSHRSVIGAKEMNLMFPYVPRWKTVILRDLKRDSIIIQDFAKATYQYSEKQPAFNWELENETKEILGHVCQRATTSFRGRKYTAWYAKDIPLYFGPYIFNGLPGLILEIEDTKNDYRFTAVAVNSEIKDIYLKNENKILVVSREKFREIQKSYHDNPKFFMGPIYDADGNEMNVRSKALPYNPIELE